MVTLQNRQVKFSLDERGRVVELENRETGWNYAGGGPLWRGFYRDGGLLEEEIPEDACVPSIQTTLSRLSILYSIRLSETIHFRVVLDLTLKGRNLSANIRLKNLSHRAILQEFQFGILNCRFRKSQSFYWSYWGGQVMSDVVAESRKWHTQYSAPDHKAIETSISYPGEAAMNYCAFADASEGLYLGCHDPKLQATWHVVRNRQDRIDALFARYPFVEPGRDATIRGMTLAPFSGDWHKAAQLYRNWAERWYKAPRVPAHVRDMKGWQRVIMKHQCGEILFHYNDLERILADGLGGGIDTILMFGWHTHGHDSGYPDYSWDRAQGGFENLKQNVRKFQAGGGKVILYFNGKMIDMASAFYRKTGRTISAKAPDGTAFTSVFRFGGDGTLYRNCGNKMFVDACFSRSEWTKTLLSFVDQAVELGADGVFFDQLGGITCQCWDRSHGHPVPYESSCLDKLAVIRTLKTYARKRKPGMSLGVEILSDMVGPASDYIHSVFYGFNHPESETVEPIGTSRHFPEMFRYTFPEIVISDRGIYDDDDVERRVNRSIALGLRSDVAVFRCRATLAETPRYREYLRKANELRGRFGDFLLRGRYRDRIDGAVDNPFVAARGFENGKRLALVLMHEKRGTVETSLALPGYRLTEHATLGAADARALSCGKTRVRLGRNGLLVAIFEPVSGRARAAPPPRIARAGTGLR